MGIFNSTHQRAHEPAHAEHQVGRHGPSLAPRRRRRLNWLEVLKLGAVTISVGALQWIKLYFLMLEDRVAQQRLQQRRGRQAVGEDQQSQKGFAANLSPESRQAVIGMIDHIVTPLLVDQWRLSLVKVMLDPGEGPVLPEKDPDMRQALLASLQSYQAERDSRPTFREGQAPARYRQQSAQRDTVPRNEPARAQGILPGPSHSALPARCQMQQAGASAVLAEHRPSTPQEPPSAPPFYPDDQHVSTSPALDDWQLVEPDEVGPSAPPLVEECGVCLDAVVEVEIDNCHHKLCSECAKAICCLEGRAPQCPFCRGAMTGVTALHANA